MAARTPRGDPSPPSARGAVPTSSQPLARGLLRRAYGWSGARGGASRRNLVRRLGLGRGSLAFGEEICGRQRAQPVRAGSAGEPKRGPGWGRRPRPRRGPRRVSFVYVACAMCCVSISPCPAAKPPGAAAALNPLRAAPAAPAAPGEGLPRPERGSRAQGGPSARSAIPPAPATREHNNRAGRGAGAAAPCALLAL